MKLTNSIQVQSVQNLLILLPSKSTLICVDKSLAPSRSGYPLRLQSLPMLFQLAGQGYSHVAKSSIYTVP